MVVSCPDWFKPGHVEWEKYRSFTWMGSCWRINVCVCIREAEVISAKQKWVITWLATVPSYQIALSKNLKSVFLSSGFIELFISIWNIGRMMSKIGQITPDYFLLAQWPNNSSGGKWRKNEIWQEPLELLVIISIFYHFTHQTGEKITLPLIPVLDRLIPVRTRSFISGSSYGLDLRWNFL